MGIFFSVHLYALYTEKLNKVSIFNLLILIYFHKLVSR